MTDPVKVAEMVKEAKRRLGSKKSVSCKIRIHKDLDETKRFIDIITDAGVDYITIHGRTRNQRSSTPPDFAAIKLLKAHARVPVLANGDVYSLKDAHSIASETGVDGVMAARGLLENPALFAGFEGTPPEAVGRFIAYASRSGLRHGKYMTFWLHMLFLLTLADYRVGLASFERDDGRILDQEGASRTGQDQ